MQIKFHGRRETLKITEQLLDVFTNMFKEVSTFVEIFSIALIWNVLENCELISKQR